MSTIIDDSNFKTLDRLQLCAYVELILGKNTKPAKRVLGHHNGFSCSQIKCSVWDVDRGPVNNELYQKKEIAMPFPLEETELQKTENKIGAILPTSYRNAMMKCNGGTVEALDDTWELFPIFDQTSRKHISRTCNNILSETESAKKWTTYHENPYAIASNGSGDLLVIFREGKGFNPNVFVWCHEDGALITVAEDFAELGRV